MWSAPLQLTNHSNNFRYSYVMFTTVSFAPYLRTKYHTRATNVAYFTTQALATLVFQVAYVITNVC